MASTNIYKLDRELPSLRELTSSLHSRTMDPSAERKSLATLLSSHVHKPWKLLQEVGKKTPAGSKRSTVPPEWIQDLFRSENVLLQRWEWSRHRPEHPEQTCMPPFRGTSPNTVHRSKSLYPTFPWLRPGTASQCIMRPAATD